MCGYFPGMCFTCGYLTYGMESEWVQYTFVWHKNRPSVCFPSIMLMFMAPSFKCESVNAGSSLSTFVVFGGNTMLHVHLF